MDDAASGRNHDAILHLPVTKIHKISVNLGKKINETLAPQLNTNTETDTPRQNTTSNHGVARIRE